MTSCAFQLVYGRIYSFYPPKWVFLSAVLVFEIGSAVCGAAPNSVAFIFGRAIAGLGSCGISAGTIVIMSDTVPVQKRPMVTGSMGSIFGVSSVVAPLLGGAFTDRVSWRWCFYINLPIGAVAVGIVLLLLKATPPPNPIVPRTPRKMLSEMDPLGTLVLLPGIVCLLLALQWGGEKYAWNNGRIIALLVLFGILMLVFFTIQIWKQDSASLPPRIIKKPSIAASAFYALCIGGSMMVIVYYIPLWFQAIKGSSAVKSGIMNLPLVLSLVVGAILSGAAMTHLGYGAPFTYACTVIMSIGAGLLTTFTTETAHPKWIGYQVVYGFGLGLGMQRPAITAQTELSRTDVPTGTALMLLCQNLGGAVFVSVGQSVFTNSLLGSLENSLSDNHGEKVAGIVAKTGATRLRDVVGADDLKAVLTAYNRAVMHAFIVSLVLSCATVVGCVFTKWVNIKEQPKSGEIEKSVGEA